ncbi:MAG TPA: MFS transporter, partial [Gemmatimonadaceae bacterium]|nr:MFS transporter [Gemmatimonadaceae bacterium]
EGAAETTASLLKLASGWWSDRVRKRKPLVLAGYVLAALARPLIAMAQTSGQVLGIRLADRVGKGIRNSPRDALIADSVDSGVRGRAFGFHRAADHAGGVLGPLIAFALMQWYFVEIRTVFWLAAIPGALAVLTLLAFVREAPRADAAMDHDEAAAANAPGGKLPRSFTGYLAAVLIFTLGNSTDAFLLLRANQLGVSVALLPVLWALLHVVKSATGTHGGALSDRIGRRPALIAGWLLYAFVYVGFAFASAEWHAWTLFVVYGVYFALTEGPERALVADLVPVSIRGTAFGWFHLTIGLGMLPASLLFGYIWDAQGATLAFLMGAALALVASLWLATLSLSDGNPA